MVKKSKYEINQEKDYEITCYYLILSKLILNPKN